jgi:hypothetical protein
VVGIDTADIDGDCVWRFPVINYSISLMEYIAEKFWNPEMRHKFVGWMEGDAEKNGIVEAGKGEVQKPSMVTDRSL